MAARTRMRVRLNRRDFLKAASLAWAALPVAFGRLLSAARVGASEADDESVDWGALVLWYNRPAREWTEALPVGNGRLGAMVFGGTSEERLQLNEDTLYGGGPYDPNNPDALDALPRARRLIFEGRYKEA